MFYVIEQTNYCNLRCVTCPNRLKQRPRGFMTPETFKDIIDQLLAGRKKMLKERVVLHGIGEPLLSPYLFENLDYLEAKEFEWVDWSDNGMLFTEEDMHRLSGYRCLGNIRISLNSTRKDLMEKINTGSNFEQVVENIRKFVKIKSQYNTPWMINVQLMTTKLNEDETEDDVRNLIGEGNYNVGLKRINNFSALVPENEMTYPGEVFLDGQCTFGKTSIMFHWDGDMVGCCDDDTKDQVICNVKDGIFSEATLTKQSKWEHEFIKNNFTNLPVCKKCLRK